MDLVDAFHESGLLAKLSLFAALGPLIAAVAYVVRPAERTLALMRPTALASVFAGVSGMCVGIITVLRGLAVSPNPGMSSVYLGLSEALVPAFFNFGLLAAAWLLIAVGMLRRARAE